jgi:hypothetical protein
MATVHGSTVTHGLPLTNGIPPTNGIQSKDEHFMALREAMANPVTWYGRGGSGGRSKSRGGNGRWVPRNPRSHARIRG